MVSEFLLVFLRLSEVLHYIYIEKEYLSWWFVPKVIPNQSPGTGISSMEWPRRAHSYSEACFLDQGLGTAGKKLGRESGRFSSEVDFNSSVLLDQKVLVIDCAPWCAMCPRWQTCFRSGVKEFLLWETGTTLPSASEAAWGNQLPGGKCPIWNSHAGSEGHFFLLCTSSRWFVSAFVLSEVSPPMLPSSS